MNYITEFIRTTLNTSIIILKLPFPLLLTSSLSRCPVKRRIEQPNPGMIKNVKFLGKTLGMFLMSPSNSIRSTCTNP